MKPGQRPVHQLRYLATNIHILPSGRDFISEGNSSLLEAGLSAGLALGYGCSNGKCGKCLAKIISGEVEKIRHHDYRLGDAKSTSGHVLMCCNAAVTDVVLEAPEAHSASEIPQQQVTAKVKSIEVVNDDVALVHLKTPCTNRLRFLAGQNVQLGGDNIPVSHQSVSSCPCDDMNLHFQVPRLADDRFSEYVFNRLNRGDPVDITGPHGNFVLNEDSPRALVFIAWHTGFGPIRSLIEHAMALDITAPISLVWIATCKQDRYLDNLCRSWEDALDNFNYVPVDARDNEVDIDLSTIKQLNIKPEDLVNHDFYIAGNQSLLEFSEQTFINNGLPSGQLTMDTIKHA